MSLQVRLVVIFVTLEVMGLYNIFQDALNIGIEHLHRQFAALGSLEDGLILFVLSWLQHIVTCQHRSNGIVASIPVTHIHTLPTPLVANDGSQQFVVLYSVWTIQFIIRGHDSPGIALLHHNLESLQIDLTKRTLGNLRDVVIAVGLLIVGHEVLRTSRRSLTLYTTHITSANGTREVGILRVILVVTSAQWITDEVHCRRENPVESELAYLVANALPHLKGCFAIPGRSQCHRSHEVGGVIIVMIPRTCSAHAQTLLRVSTVSLRNTQTIY